MIIARKFEWLGILYNNDAVSRIIIDEAFLISNVDPERKKYLLDYNQNNIPAFLSLGCGIPGTAYKYMLDEFEKIDKTSPYDNKLTFKDVTDIEFETSRKGTAIQMRFVKKLYDIPYRIVGFAALDNKEDKLTINKGWEMTTPWLN